mmetsp:Transcript_24355/g.45055  ORF Transcript_24355/g.45055 Transcript_24355/m.45055 type:complete len:132 (+) Transcript_24355:1120-1515(+)
MVVSVFVLMRMPSMVMSMFMVNLFFAMMTITRVAVIRSAFFMTVVVSMGVSILRFEYLSLKLFNRALELGYVSLHSHLILGIKLFYCVTNCGWSLRAGHGAIQSLVIDLAKVNLLSGVGLSRRRLDKELFK